LFFISNITLLFLILIVGRYGGEGLSDGLIEGDNEGDMLGDILGDNDGLIL
jgi:hypothetical protein